MYSSWNKFHKSVFKMVVPIIFQKLLPGECCIAESLPRIEKWAVTTHI